MNRAIRIPNRWRLVARFAAALGLAGAVTLTGLPGVPVEHSEAAPVTAKLRPGTGKRCDSKHLGKSYGTTPRNSGFPTTPGTNFDAWKGDPKNFNYPLPSKAFDGLKAPTAAEEAKALSKVPGDRTKNVEAWKKQAAATGDPADRAMEIYARFLEKPRPKGFDHFFRGLVTNESNRTKGDAFERQVVRDFRLIGPDWLCEVYVDLFDADGKPAGYRKYDAYNQRTKEFNEFKSNSKPELSQLRKDRVIAKSMPDHTFRFVGAKNFEAKHRKLVDDFNRDVERMRPGRTNQVRGFQRQYNLIPQTKPIPGYSRYDTWFAPGCQGGPAGQPRLAAAGAGTCGSRGPLNDRVNGSGRTLNEARQIQAEARRLDTRGTMPRGGPGGIDFTTLELRYVGGLAKGKGMQYSMKADMMPDPDEDPGFGGQEKVQLASDALFTWLALTPDKFWVNLNPDEPNRVMDAKFASTDAGRVLLEADLQMKHDFFKAMDPKTDLGKRYWAALPKDNGNPCMPGLRNWIEPKPAQVREQDGGIYILDAPLALKSTAQKTVTHGPGEPICDPGPEQVKAAQKVVDALIVPEVEKIINTAPQYADLRRVYTSRVAAEWIRQQDAKQESDFRKIIGSDDVKRWPLRAPHENWDKDELFKRYRKIFIDGEFTYDVDTDHGVRVYIVGGVDFSKQPKKNISKVRFVTENRTLDTTTTTSMRSDDTSYRDTDILYIGGDSSGDTGGGNPTPTPSPKPTTPKPTGEPTVTPTAQPSHTPAPTATPGRPGGDLAHTGSDTPIGTIAGVAAAVIAVGAGLVWWMRRRRSTTG
ncbi:LAETG motif-containing sortase-dependent surface protein [Streptomyces sp. NPDC048018]|uniref:LAETG motif-containing sortase-dependent surface protein n=1 Tax=Streptomyces sp. NPDC048018 TaxID=3365499 RepID=UPI00371A8602